MESGHSTTAVEHFRAAEEVNHYYFPAIYDLATILVSDGKFEQASKRFDRLISEQPNFYGGYAGRAVVEARRGRLSLAEEAIRKARALAPSEPKVLVSEGDILAARGKRDEAADAYAQAIELDPQLAVAQAHLAALRLEEGRLTEAAEAAMRAVGLAPHEPQGYLLAARAYQQRNQYEQAVAILREALAKIPHLMEAANDLAWILATHPDAQIRNGAEAVDWAEQASSAAGGRDFARLDTLAAALAEQGRWEEAEAAAQRALELANQAVDSRAIEEITSRLQLYRQRQPFRTS